MSEENKQPQDTRKDLDILNKMKKPPGRSGNHPVGNCGCTCNICTAGIPDRRICNSTVL